MSFDRTRASSTLFRICFVCTGNICRSPMAEVVFTELVRAAGYDGAISVMSAGTGDWHVGERSDDRTVAALAAHGYDGTAHRARQFDPDWFADLDLVVVFDRGQERIIKAWAQTDDDRGKVALLLGFDDDQQGHLDVPDPYYSDAAMFDTVLKSIERASAALFRQVKPGIRLPPSPDATTASARRAVREHRAAFTPGPLGEPGPDAPDGHRTEQQRPVTPTAESHPVAPHPVAPHPAAPSTPGAP